MSSLADAFPEDKRRRFAADNLAIGTVIKAFVSDTTPPKEKRLIIMGTSYDKVCVATVYINSELNAKIFPTKELRDLNYFIESVDREYIDHDSYIDCSNLHILKREVLQNIIVSNTNRVLGTISEDDYKILRDLIKSAKTIKPSLKKTYGLFL
ncbi:MAG TPA: hypothetical protein VIM55_14730 [Mucilaginibacter sp.]